MISTLEELKALASEQIKFKDTPRSMISTCNPFGMTVDRDEEYKRLLRSFVDREISLKTSQDMKRVIVSLDRAGAWYLIRIRSTKCTVSLARLVSLI
jgi:hypothetical protein